MAASGNSDSVYRWAIELEDIEFAGVDTNLSDVCCVKAIQVPAPPQVAGCAARVELVPFPENYELSQDTLFAEILEWPEETTAGTVIVKTVDTPHLPSAPTGTVFLDTVKLPSIEAPGGITVFGNRVPVIHKRRLITTP